MAKLKDLLNANPIDSNGLTPKDSGLTPQEKNQSFIRQSGFQSDFNPVDQTTGIETDELRSFERYGVAYDPTKDNADIRAQQQSPFEKAFNGLTKFVGNTTIQTVSNLLALPVAIGGVISTGSISGAYDNSVFKFADDLQEQLRETLPNYRRSEENLNLFQSIIKDPANFWFDDVAQGASFTVSALLAGYLTSGFSAGLGKVGSLPRIISQLSNGTRNVAAAADAAFDATRALRNVNIPGFLLQSSVGALYEAGVEARHFKNEFIKENKAKLEGLEKTGKDEVINKLAEDGANAIFASNLFLLTASNALQFPSLFGIKASRNAARVLKNADEFVGNVPNALRFYSGQFAKNALVEGFGEEGLQGVTKLAIEKKQNNTIDDYVDTLYDTTTAKDGYSIADAAIDAFAENYTSKEGLKEILIGSLIGGGFSFLESSGEYKQIKEDTTKALEELRAYKKTTDLLKSVNSMANFKSSEQADVNNLFEYAYVRAKYGFGETIAEDLNSVIDSVSDEELGKLTTKTKDQLKSEVEGIQTKVNKVKTEIEKYEDLVNENKIANDLINSGVEPKLVMAQVKLLKDDIVKAFVQNSFFNEEYLNEEYDSLVDIIGGFKMNVDEAEEKLETNYQNSIQTTKDKLDQLNAKLSELRSKETPEITLADGTVQPAVNFTDEIWRVNQEITAISQNQDDIKNQYELAKNSLQGDEFDRLKEKLRKTKNLNFYLNQLKDNIDDPVKLEKLQNLVDRRETLIDSYNKYIANGRYTELARTILSKKRDLANQLNTQQATPDVEDTQNQQTSTTVDTEPVLKTIQTLLESSRKVFNFFKNSIAILSPKNQDDASLTKKINLLRSELAVLTKQLHELKDIENILAITEKEIKEFTNLKILKSDLANAFSITKQILQEFETALANNKNKSNETFTNDEEKVIKKIQSYIDLASGLLKETTATNETFDKIDQLNNHLSNIYGYLASQNDLDLTKINPVVNELNNLIKDLTDKFGTRPPKPPVSTDVQEPGFNSPNFIKETIILENGQMVSAEVKNNPYKVWNTVSSVEVESVSFNEPSTTPRLKKINNKLYVRSDGSGVVVNLKEGFSIARTSPKNYLILKDGVTYDELRVITEQFDEFNPLDKKHLDIISGSVWKPEEVDSFVEDFLHFKEAFEKKDAKMISVNTVNSFDVNKKETRKIFNSPNHLIELNGRKVFVIVQGENIKIYDSSGKMLSVTDEDLAAIELIQAPIEQYRSKLNKNRYLGIISINGSYRYAALDLNGVLDTSPDEEKAEVLNSINQFKRLFKNGEFNIINLITNGYQGLYKILSSQEFLKNYTKDEQDVFKKIVSGRNTLTKDEVLKLLFSYPYKNLKNAEQHELDLINAFINGFIFPATRDDSGTSYNFNLTRINAGEGEINFNLVTGFTRPISRKLLKAELIDKLEGVDSIEGFSNVIENFYNAVIYSDNKKSNEKINDVKLTTFKARFNPTPATLEVSRSNVNNFKLNYSKPSEFVSAASLFEDEEMSPTSRSIAEAIAAQRETAVNIVPPIDIKNETEEQRRERFNREVEESFESENLNPLNPNIEFFISERNDQLVDSFTALENLKRILPEWIRVDFNLENIVRNLELTGTPMGVFIDSVISLREGTIVKGTEYHEAFHAVFRTMLTNTQIDNLFKEAKLKYKFPLQSELDDLKINHPYLNDEAIVELYYEEKLAESFRRYKNNTETFIGRIFNKLKEFVNWIFNNKSEIDSLFINISKGRFKSAKRLINRFDSDDKAFAIFGKYANNAQIGYLSHYESKLIVNKTIQYLLNSVFSVGTISDKNIKDAIVSMQLHYYTTNPDAEDFKSEYMPEILIAESKGDMSIRKRLYAFSSSTLAKQNIPTIFKEVKKIVQDFKIKDSLPTVEDEVGESKEDDAPIEFGQKEALEIGGEESLSKRMKLFLRQISMHVDEFNIGLTDEELKNLKHFSPIDPITTHNILEKVLADTDQRDILKKLYFVSKYNKTIKAVFKYILKAVDMEDWTPSDTLPKKVLDSSVYRMLQSNYNKSKAIELATVFSEVDDTVKVLVFEANAKNVDTIQIQEWNYLFRKRNKKIAPSIIVDRIKLAFEDVTVDTIDETVKYVESEFLKIGMKIAPAFIDWSLQNKLKGYLSDEQKNVLEVFDSSIELSLDAFLEDDSLLNPFLEALKKENPFINEYIIEQATNRKVQVKNDITSLLKRIANSNAIFDDTISPSVYVDADGKKKYDKQFKSFLSRRMELLRKPALREWLNLPQEEAIPYIQSHFEIGYNEAVLTYKTLRTNKLLTSTKTFESKFRPFYSGAIRYERSYSSINNGQYELINVNSNAVKFSKEDIRTKLIAELAFYGDEAQKSKNEFGRFIPLIIETKENVPAVRLPNKNYYEDKITDEFLNDLFDLFKVEYDTIKDTQKDVTKATVNGVFKPELLEYRIKGFNDGKIQDLRGLKFFHFADFAKEFTNFNLVDLAKSGNDPTPNQVEEIKKSFRTWMQAKYKAYYNGLIENSILSETEEGASLGLVHPYFIDEIKAADGSLKKVLNRAKLANFFLNDYIQSYQFSQLLTLNDQYSHKNFTDKNKRNASLNASGPAMVGTFKIAIVPSVYRELDEELVDSGGSVDSTDAQSIATMSHFIKFFVKGLGKDNAKGLDILYKIRAGIPITSSENDFLYANNLQVSPKKDIYYDALRQYKTSTKTLLIEEMAKIKTGLKKELVLRNWAILDEMIDSGASESAISKYYINVIHPMYKPFPHRKVLWKQFTELNVKGIDKLVYDSASKRTTEFLGKYKSTIDDVQEIELNPVQLDGRNYREQVNNDGVKTKTIHGTQEMQLISSEQDPNIPVRMYGVNMTIGDVTKGFINQLAKRVTKGYKKLEKLLNKEYIIDSIQSSLEASNSNASLIEYTSKTTRNGEVEPKYSLNMPHLQNKLHSVILAMLSKDTLKQKRPGYKGTMVSDEGYRIIRKKDESVIRTDQYLANEIEVDAKIESGEYSIDRLKYGLKHEDGYYYAEAIVPAFIAELYDLKPGDQITVNKGLLFASRIPTQDKSSMVTLMIVDVLPRYAGNAIIVPYEVVKLTGADFDIDSKYAGRYANRPDGLAFGEYIKEASMQKRYLLAEEDIIFDLIETNEDARRYYERKTNNNLKYELLHNQLLIGEILYPDNEVVKDHIAYIERYLSQKIIEKNRDNAKLYAKSVEKRKNSANSIINKKYDLDKILNLTTIFNNDYKKHLFEKAGYEITGTYEEFFENTFGKTIESNRKLLLEGKLSEINALTKSEINNLLISMEVLLAHNEGNKDIARHPIEKDDLDEAKKLISKLKAENNVGVSEITSAFSALDKVLHFNNQYTGKPNIGVYAVANIAFTYLYQAKVNLEKAIGGKKSFGTINALGRVVDELGKRIVAGMSGQLSSATDNAKEQDAAVLNLSLDNAAIAATLTMLGFNFKTTALILNHPTILNVTRLMDVASSPLKTKNDLSKRDIINNLKLKIEKVPENFNSITEEDLKNEFRQVTERVEKQVIHIYLKALQFNEESIQFTRLLSLAKGEGSTLEDVINIYKALNRLGISASYNPVKVNEKPILNWSEVINSNPFLKNNLVTHTKIFNELGDIFITANKNILDFLQTFSEYLSPYALGESGSFGALQNELLLFLGAKAFTNLKNRKYSIESIFVNNQNKNNLVNLYEQVLLDPVLSKNEFVKALKLEIEPISNTSSSPFRGRRIPIFGIETFNVTTDVEDKLMGYFADLFSSENGNQFARELLAHELKLNAFAFKNKSLIRFIPPAIMNGYTESLREVEKTVKSDREEDYEKTFGKNKSELFVEFIQMYMLQEQNTPDLHRGRLKKSNKNIIFTGSILGIKASDDLAEAFPTLQIMRDNDGLVEALYPPYLVFNKKKYELVSLDGKPFNKLNLLIPQATISTTAQYEQIIDRTVKFVSPYAFEFEQFEEFASRNGVAIEPSVDDLIGDTVILDDEDSPIVLQDNPELDKANLTSVSSDTPLNDICNG